MSKILVFVSRWKKHSNFCYDSHCILTYEKMTSVYAFFLFIFFWLISISKFQKTVDKFFSSIFQWVIIFFSVEQIKMYYYYIFKLMFAMQAAIRENGWSFLSTEDKDFFKSFAFLLPKLWLKNICKSCCVHFFYSVHFSVKACKIYGVLWKVIWINEVREER